MPALAPIVAFLVALFAARLLLTPAGRRIALDKPNERSLHAQPVPRTGGIAIAAGIAAGCALVWPGLPVILLAAAALAAVSFADDVLGLPTLVRLALHFAAAVAVLALDLEVTAPLLFVVLALALAWTANLYNFMDGADGLAGGMAVFGFGAYGLAAYLSGAATLAALCASIAAASAAFLVFNWHPARLFMGDVGSVPVGFLAGALGLRGWLVGIWPLWFPLLVFAPFMCDATLTLLKRLVRRERVWQAHREHYYQRLVRMGFGHRGAALIEYVAMAACAAVALAVLRQPAPMQAYTLALAFAALAAVAVWIDVRWGRRP
ncbi:MAG: glycosyltransferase family 4 protein [Betaproteobacteria bacterium]|nr:glycosyltransferase family 4 protein [Betaproteobacteria bacterium]